MSGKPVFTEKEQKPPEQGKADAGVLLPGGIQKIEGVGPNPGAQEVVRQIGHVQLARADQVRPGDQGDKPVAGKDQKPNVHVAEQTTTLDGKTVSVQKQFSKLTEVKIEGTKGLPTQGLKNVVGQTDYFSTDGKKVVAQEFKLDSPGMYPITIITPDGQLMMKPNNLSVARGEDGKATELTYFCKTAFLSKGDKTLNLSGHSVNISLNDKGAPVIALAPVMESPSAYIRFGTGAKISPAEADQLIQQLEAPKFDDRQTASKKLIDHNQDPYVVDKLTKIIEKGRLLESKARAEAILTALPKRSAPATFKEKMQDWTSSLLDTQFATEELVDKGHTRRVLSTAERQKFETLIKESDQPIIAGETQQNLQAKAAALDTELQQAHKALDKMDGKEIPGDDDQAPHAENQELITGAQIARSLVSPEQAKLAKIAEEERLTKLALDLPAVTRIMYAEALSRTEIESDAQRAVNILTNLVNKNPEAILNPNSIAFVQANNALKNSKALDDQTFIDACKKQDAKLPGDERARTYLDRLRERVDPVRPTPGLPPPPEVNPAVPKGNVPPLPANNQGIPKGNLPAAPGDFAKAKRSFDDDQRLVG